MSSLPSVRLRLPGKGVIKVSGERYPPDALSDFARPGGTLSSGWEQPGPRCLGSGREAP